MPLPPFTNYAPIKNTLYRSLQCAFSQRCAILKIPSKITIFFLHYFRSAFVPVAPSTHSLTTYPSFLTGLPHPATAAASAAQQQLLTGTISVYSDLLQHQLTRSSEAMHGHSNILNNSLGHTSTEDELDSSGASRRQSKSNKKQSKQRNSKVKYLPYNYGFILVILQYLFENFFCMSLNPNNFFQFEI